MTKQFLYIAAVVVVMIIASRYMKKIKDNHPTETESGNPLLQEEEEDPESDETAQPHPDTSDR